MELVQAQEITDKLLNLLKEHAPAIAIVGKSNAVLYFSPAYYEDFCEALHTMEGSICSCGCGNTFTAEDYFRPEYEYDTLSKILGMDVVVKSDWVITELEMAPKNIPIDRYMQMKNAHLN